MKLHLLSVALLSVVVTNVMTPFKMLSSTDSLFQSILFQFKNFRQKCKTFFLFSLVQRQNKLDRLCLAERMRLDSLTNIRLG